MKTALRIQSTPTEPAPPRGGPVLFVSWWTEATEQDVLKAFSTLTPRQLGGRSQISCSVEEESSSRLLVTVALSRSSSMTATTDYERIAVIEENLNRRLAPYRLSQREAWVQLYLALPDA